MIFGITGGSGAGKSTVSDIFRRMGVYVADADKIARIVVEPGEECLKEITRAFGAGILNNDGTMNRSRVADIVFSDKNKLVILNKITHKYIHERIIKEISLSKSKLAAIDGAVIIGSPVEKSCEKMVAVTADDAVRLSRIMARDGIDKQRAVSRLKSQPPQSFYIQHADYIIENNGNEEKLYNEVQRIIKELSEKDI